MIDFVTECSKILSGKFSIISILISKADGRQHRVLSKTTQSENHCIVGLLGCMQCEYIRKVLTCLSENKAAFRQVTTYETLPLM